MTKQRADILLAEQGLFHSRSAAQRAIMAGLVSDHNHQRIDKSGTKFPEGEKFYVKDDGKKYVSRGGFKLEKALKVFNIDLTDKICLDIGASTGILVHQLAVLLMLLYKTVLRWSMPWMLATTS